MIVIWVLINGLQEITFKNYEQNSIKDIKIKGKEVLKIPIKKYEFKFLLHSPLVLIYNI